MIADKEIVADRIFAAVNLTYEPDASRSRITGEWEHQSGFGITTAVTTQVWRGVLIGAEARYLRAYAVATGSLATALGPNASTTAANAVAIGSGSLAEEDNSVSVGAPGKERRITAGIAPSDAATVGQVASLQAQIEDLRRECGLPPRTARANGE